MDIANRKQLLIALIFCLINLGAFAQPVFDTGKEIQGIIVYQDLLQKSKYYYVPGNLELGRNSDGSPMFKYLKMANSKLSKTGTSAQLKDLNLIQISLVNPKFSQQELLQIKAALGGKNVRLLPMPIGKFEFALLQGIESVGKTNILGSHLEASYEGSGIWEKKTISIRLSQVAAGLVDQHIKDFNQPGIHFTYSYYTDFVTGMDEIYNEDEASFASPVKDTSIHKLAYKTAVFDLNIDLEKWGEQCIKEIILNEAILPRYLPLQVSCYDFSDDLRPDLLLKKVKVCGDGLQNLKNCVMLDFEKERSDVNAYSLRFQSPILMTSPLRYQVIEINTMGKVEISPWTTIQAGESIDITSTERERQFINKIVEFETNPEEMKKAGFQKVAIQLNYQVNQKMKQKNLIVDLAEDNSYLTTNFFCDKDTPVSYSIKWLDDTNTSKGEKTTNLDSDYIYLKP